MYKLQYSDPAGSLCINEFQYMDPCIIRRYKYLDPAGSIWIDMYKYVNNIWILQDPNVSDGIQNMDPALSIPLRLETIYGSCRIHKY